MRIESRLVSVLARSPWAQACVIGACAALLAWSVWTAAPVSFAALEWIPYDMWLRHHQPVPVNPALLLIRRDAASESRFGPGPWDRAILARTVTALHRAGATAIGLDVSVLDPSPASRGGAASDALLLEATSAAGNVVYPLPLRAAVGDLTLLRDDGVEASDVPSHDSWLMLPQGEGRGLFQAVRPMAGMSEIARQAAGIGHTARGSDADGIMRRVPLFAAMGNRAIPSFEMALASVSMKLRPEQVVILPAAIELRRAKTTQEEQGHIVIPVDEHAQMLIHYAQAWPGRGFAVLSFVHVWDAIERADSERLREWMEGKVVLFHAEHDSASFRTPLDHAMDQGVLQAQAMNTILSGQWVTAAGPGWRLAVTLALAVIGAWVLLTKRGWRGVVAAAGLAGGYAILLGGSLILAGFILPFVVPVSALISAAGGVLLWLHMASGEHLRRLEGDIQEVQQELTAVRDTLVRRESLVEGLEEDLETARLAATRSATQQQDLARSAEMLRTQLGEAQAQEDVTRSRLEELEKTLAGLRAVSTEPMRLSDAELERLRQECERLGILTRDVRVLALFRDVKKAARSLIPVLLLGEPGTGKELFARAVHRLSPRASRPFIAVNMAAISSELFESELFGHVKGSFTGALGDRKGYFELAAGGTLFLDEIGDLRLDHQGKLLRVLQDKTFYRVGATQSMTVDVRVVAATNRDLQRGVSEGWFREDLYFRVKGLVIRLPPLHERASDVPILAQHMLGEFAAQARRPGLALSSDAMDALIAHRWEGNIRELQHCLEQAVALSDGPVITRDDLRLVGASPEDAIAPAFTGVAADGNSDDSVLNCLRRHEFDMQATARALGWDRSTVTQRLKGMGFRALVQAGGDHAKAALQLAGNPALSRTVELKLLDYSQHLIQTVGAFASADEAILVCKRRFKNLPERHFRSVEALIRQHFDGTLPHKSVPPL